MTTYYVDPVNGNNANNGLGPDASAATNKPWSTMAKVLGAAGIASGDTVYMAPGTYRETVSILMTSATVTTNVIGDVENSSGFKTSGGVLVAPGPVVWTAYTTNDTTVPSSSACLGINTRDFLSFSNIIFLAGTGACVSTAAGSTDITFTDCHFNALTGGAGVIQWTVAAGVTCNWTIDRCTFISRTNSQHCSITLTRHTADYNAGIVIRNCMSIGPVSLAQVGSTGSGTGFGGGITVRDCTLVGSAIRTTDANLSTSSPISVVGCLFLGASTAINANTAGQIVEDYNVVAAATPRTNVTPGTHSISDGSRSLGIDVNNFLVTKQQPRPFGTPMAGSPFLGFGDDGAGPAVDLWNRPRPAGGLSIAKAIGALERHDTAAKETGTTDAGGVGVHITGPGDHDLLVPVDATSTTITVRARYDSTHAATNKPQAQLLANGEVGYAGETQTMTVAADTWETLTFSAFTPTAKSYVTLRLVSRAAAGGGIAFFDTITVT